MNFITATLVILLCGTAFAQNDTSPKKTPVVVELFTSEGCSSCPPADALAARINHEQPVSNAEIIVMEEHVDYWENGGWHDRFSAHQYTQRQSDYDAHLHAKNGIYTPQLVIDGSTQVLGTDPSQALASIAAAAQTPKPQMIITNLAVNGHRVSASVTAASFPGKGDLYAALLDPSDSTDVKGGENKNQHLDHSSVVRTMQHIGNLKDLAAGPHAFGLNAPNDAIPAGMRLVVFAQRGDGGPIVGAASTLVTPIQKN